MNFNQHYYLEGKHAFLGASKYHWVNYDDDKFDEVYRHNMAASRGTRLHALAAEMVKLGVKLPENTKTLNSYVNDVIGFRMTPEQILFYSKNCFGTADAISFRANKLRIFDLKTGTSKANELQLYIYAALFCLEYKINPNDIEYDLRIYQNDDVLQIEVDVTIIFHIMDRIITFDRRISELEEEAE